MSYVYRQFPESNLIKSVSLRSGEDNTGLSTLHVKMRSTGRVLSIVLVVVGSTLSLTRHSGVAMLVVHSAETSLVRSRAPLSTADLN